MAKFKLSKGKLITLVAFVLLVVLAIVFVQDWHQLWIISSSPDNIPIVAMLFLVPIFTWMGVRQARANDKLIVEYTVGNPVNIITIARISHT